jgi:hypothetical protein
MPKKFSDISGNKADSVKCLVIPFSAVRGPISGGEDCGTHMVKGSGNRSI